jgi:hypothetical protein
MFLVKPTPLLHMNMINAIAILRNMSICESDLMVEMIHSVLEGQATC